MVSESQQLLYMYTYIALRSNLTNFLNKHALNNADLNANIHGSNDIMKMSSSEDSKRFPKIFNKSTLTK